MEGRPAQAHLPGRIGARPATHSGGFVVLDGESYYRISAFHLMPPFLVSLASDTDLWMFVTSRGGLTAGRVDAEGSLFPYQTVDQLHDAHHHTGPLTLIQVESESAGSVLWEPFCELTTEITALERNLYKNTVGNRLVFEEINHDLGLAFRYRWAGCDDLGWIRSATLENRGASPVRATLLDGLRNILPHGVQLSLYQQASNLVDAYKKSEVDPETDLGIFSLTAGITDRAEALEVLRANTVWCCGLDDYRVHLSLEAVSAFRNGRVIAGESVLNGNRGNYLVSSSLDLTPGQSSQWHIAGDTGRDHLQIADLRRCLMNDKEVEHRILDSLRLARENLKRNVASADGLQLTGHPESASHHFANVLFNNMRGGVFTQNYEIPVADFMDFLQVRNRDVARRQQASLANWPEVVTVGELLESTRETGDTDFERLGHEYLPLYFGRRHGDPSRPWNRFSIRVRDRNGQRALNYEGNWRDIFQNWEALSAAFPGFLPSIVAKFVNASTVDGFNPYRITREGVDWETVTPDDSWSNIGYWGDHQIIYLLKLLETMGRSDPAALGAMLGAQIFSYAEVPYIIKPYADILRDPGSTIDFDTVRASRIDDRVENQGSDGKLVTAPDGSVYHVNLLEKLLVPALSKLSNMIPGAGVWMNTQRPEWNDANNALGGGGVSVVTLCYLRRYLAFLADLLEDRNDGDLPLSTEVADWFDQIVSVLESEQGLLEADRLDARDRKRLMDSLGDAFSTYRNTVYSRGFSGQRNVASHRIAALYRTALQFIDRGIAANRRDDGLYHTYNLLEFADDGGSVSVAHLQEMLEGQVAVLSSGALQPAEALEILERLFASDLYRPDQRSFMLYPERELPGFLAKNTVTTAAVESIPLLQELVASGDQSLLARDAADIYRFHGDLQNAHDLAATLDELGRQEQWTDGVTRDRAEIMELFETVFGHRSYTGRSGIMYGYEGLGCIYWHMVAKLLLAIQETVLRAEREGAAPSLQAELTRMYFQVRAGIGYEKTVTEYGAFPTDPYSHTPAGGGAKQPGMTGQVKEEILTRLGELGVHIVNGTVRFRPMLLRSSEFLTEPDTFQYFDVDGDARAVAVPANGLAFTLCQVPVIYERVAGEPSIGVSFADGSTSDHPGGLLDARLGAELLSRSGWIDSIRVAVREESPGSS